MSLILPFAAALSYVIGGVFMKLSDGLRQPGPTALVFVAFCTGAALQTLAMRRADLGVAYVMVLGMEAVLAFGLGVALFDERVEPMKVAGLLLVTAGIYVLNRPVPDEATDATNATNVTTPATVLDQEAVVEFADPVSPVAIDGDGAPRKMKAP